MKEKKKERQRVENIEVSGSDGQPLDVTEKRAVMRALVEGREARGLDAKAK